MKYREGGFVPPANPVTFAEPLLTPEQWAELNGKPSAAEPQADERYLRLAAVLDLAYAQAARGKGAERHAGGLPFDEQPMQQISRLLDSPKGMAFQAIKKVREGLELPTPERQVAELLGAINYLAGIVIYIEDNAESEA